MIWRATICVVLSLALTASANDWRDELREALKSGAPNRIDDDTRWELKLEVRKLIADHQPDANEFITAAAIDANDPLNRLAVNAFVDRWATMSREQIHRYLDASIIPTFQKRDKYPRGVGAMLGMGFRFRHGYGSRPVREKLKIVTVTTHFLDGKQYGQPFRYPYDCGGCTTGWIQTKKLSLGKHRARITIDYVAGEGDDAVSGTVRSGEIEFEMLPEDTPDDLLAADDPKVDQLVRSSLEIVETEDDWKLGATHVFTDFSADPPDPWRPQIRWRKGDGWEGIHVPIVGLDKPLPVDLCFTVTMRVDASGEEFECDPLVVTKNTQRMRSYCDPRETTALCKGRSGFVPVRTVLKPSRAAALSDPRITRYFGGEIYSHLLRIKIGPATD